MAEATPETELQQQYSREQAVATEWAEAVDLLTGAEIFWIATVRRGGHPHVTPLMAVWDDGALHFCTGPEEQKAKNLAADAHCALTTGCNKYGEGLDIVVEGDAVRVTDHATLARLALLWESKYGAEWHFEPRNGAFGAEHGEAWVFRVEPVKAFGFGRGPKGAATRWRFAP